MGFWESPLDKLRAAPQAQPQPQPKLPPPAAAQSAAAPQPMRRPQAPVKPRTDFGFKACGGCVTHDSKCSKIDAELTARYKLDPKHPDYHSKLDDVRKIALG